MLPAGLMYERLAVCPSPPVKQTARFDSWRENVDALSSAAIAKEEEKTGIDDKVKETRNAEQPASPVNFILQYYC